MPYFAALLSGLLVALSFPTIVAGYHFPDLSYLAWVALIPYFWALRGVSLKRAAGMTFVFSLAWNALTSYWIFNALYFNGQLSVPASLGVLFLMAFLLASLQSVFIPFGLYLTRRFSLSWILIFPSFWAIYEWLRNYWPFGGYPWANLGYSQADSLYLLQSADLFGVFGLSFLIVFVNLAIGDFFWTWKRSRPLAVSHIVSAVILLAAFLGYGKLRLGEMEKVQASSPQLAIGLLQPNISQEFKWKKDLNDYIQRLLIQMTQDAIRGGAKFVIWPESSLPIALPLKLQEFAPLNQFQVPILLGITSTEENPQGNSPFLYNSALQVEPGGSFSGRMHKQHLVPLGEYVPLPKILWFVQPIATRMGKFRTVPDQDILKVAGHPYGVVICYEDLFPEISRQYTRQGALFLVNITNDAWYGDSSQLDQHLNFSRFRAVENRRSLLRGTNTGYTAAIEPSGRIHAEIPKFILGILLTEIPLNDAISIYTRWGDILWISLALLSVGISFALAKREKKFGS